MPIFAWNVPLVSLIFLKRSLVFPILLFSTISLYWSLRRLSIASCYSLELCIQTGVSFLFSFVFSFSSFLRFDRFQFTLIHGANTPGSYAVLFFTASNFTRITIHIHNWVLFSLWFHLFILSGVISVLFSSSILGTCLPGEFLFQYPIFLPFQTVHGVPKARILKWFALPFSKEPHFVRTLHHDPSILGGPIWHGSLGSVLHVDSLPAESPGKPVYLFSYHLICQSSIKLSIDHLSIY